MERIIRLFIIFIFVLVTGANAIADEKSNLLENPSLTTPQIISFENCTKKYEIPVEKLFILTLASINANKFTIDEIQSRNGYILFKGANKQFLASVHRVDTDSSILKIVPANNNYYFPPGIITNIQKYIDLNLTTKIEELNKN